MDKCLICGEGTKVHYQGPIRLGKFGNLSKEPHSVTSCPDCLSIALPNTFGDQEGYYQSETYRKDVDDGAEAADYFRNHDGEQAANLGVLGTAMFRGMRVADIGCGAGSFLDGVRGYASQAMAVEPYSVFRDSLKRRGYIAYPFLRDALAEQKGKVDIATSFSVLEHVEKPREFLSEMRELLAPGGRAIISTPNAEDLLMEAVPDAYPPFFYRQAHLWYFNRESLERLMRLSGFSKIRIIPHQRFGLGNFLGWLRDRRPQGDIKPSWVGPAVDAAWKAELERTWRCDYLYAEAHA